MIFYKFVLMITDHCCVIVLVRPSFRASYESCKKGFIKIKIWCCFRCPFFYPDRFSTNRQCRNFVSCSMMENFPNFSFLRKKRKMCCTYLTTDRRWFVLDNSVRFFCGTKILSQQVFMQYFGYSNKVNSLAHFALCNTSNLLR